MTSAIPPVRPITRTSGYTPGESHEPPRTPRVHTDSVELGQPQTQERLDLAYGQRLAARPPDAVAPLPSTATSNEVISDEAIKEAARMEAIAHEIAAQHPEAISADELSAALSALAVEAQQTPEHGLKRLSAYLQRLREVTYAHSNTARRAATRSAMIPEAAANDTPPAPGPTTRRSA